MDAVQGIFSLGMSIGQVPTQLHDELEQLHLKLPSARLLISRSEWGVFRNKELEDLVLHLKYATYDAEDLLRGFEDQALRQNVEDASRSRAGQLVSSSLNIAKHFILASSKRVRNTQDMLDKVMAEVEKVLNLMGLDRVEPVQFMPTTTQVITASQVFGRDTERDQLMEVLGVTATIDREEEINQVITQLGVPLAAGSKRKSRTAVGCGALASTRKSANRLRGNSSNSAPLAVTTNFTGNVSVLPIFGIGGIGKTTLAQLIHNDQRVKVHFTMRIWVCVSDLFDIERMTKEIVRTISDPNSDLPSDFSDLQAKLMEQLKSQKFLLVLDDIWQITQQQWESFYATLRNGLQGSMILVTTRHENIAHLVSTRNCKPVELKELHGDIFWEFFKECAFGKECPESYPRLQEIGRSISSKLCGSPLAAKTLGRLLNSNLTEEHWIRINDSELWEQEQQEGEILPALRLSYLYLPSEHRRCFAFCSIFPKDYSFVRQEIVGIWVAEGFISSRGSIPLEDVGISYLNELRGRCLFQTDPKFPKQNRYVMHDLVHDTAQYVSLHECFSMKKMGGKIYKHRHMSVEVDSTSLSKMKSIPDLNKLRSLRFGTRTILNAEITWFSRLSNILFLSLKGCNLESLPESICVLNSLRYLDISASRIKELPANFGCLYNLQFVVAIGSQLQKIHEDVTKLINLRQLELPWKASIALSKVPGLGNLSCLQNLSLFTVGMQNGGIGELKGMNQLRGILRIRSIHTVKSKEEAAAAMLVEKKYLKELDLNWRTQRACEPSPDENEVADSLCPNDRIERLKFNGFGGDRLPRWFNPNDLQNLRNLELSLCPYIRTFSIPYFTGGTQGGSTAQHSSSSTNCSNGIITSLAFRHLTCISIVRCNGLKNLDQFLTPKSLPSVKSILLERCDNLESIPADSFVGFVHLRDLKLCDCRSLVCPQSREMVLPHSLRRLCIQSCGQLDRWFPSCLEKLTSLTVLCLVACDNVESIPLDSIPCRNKLKFLLLGSCTELSSIGGSGVPSSIEYVSVYNCHNLTQVSQPFIKVALPTEQVKKIKKFRRMAPNAWSETE